MDVRSRRASRPAGHSPRTPSPTGCAGTIFFRGADMLRLNGIDHTARPTWKLRETVHFYRDILGVPLVHAISARGWGTASHPDFLHFFFDSGQGSSIAFFYYLGSQEPASLREHQGTRPAPDDHVFDATHVSWLVDSREELQTLRQRLESHGIEASPDTRHET